MLKQKHFIDTHKGITPLFILYLIYYFNQWNNINAILYLALHGSYGILWIAKSVIYGDKQWESKTSIWYGATIWIALSLYWISPYVITTGNHFIPFNVSHEIIHIGCCVSLFIFGVFLHFTSDMQKYVSLNLKHGHLITTGMFRKSRNTNYLGELCIYLGFTLLAKDLLPLIGLLLIILIIWVPNMFKKDRSLSRYPEFESYKKKTGRFFPFSFF